MTLVAEFTSYPSSLIRVPSTSVADSEDAANSTPDNSDACTSKLLDLSSENLAITASKID